MWSQQAFLVGEHFSRLEVPKAQDQHSSSQLPVRSPQQGAPPEPCTKEDYVEAYQSNALITSALLGKQARDTDLERQKQVPTKCLPLAATLIPALAQIGQDKRVQMYPNHCNLSQHKSFPHWSPWRNTCKDHPYGATSVFHPTPNNLYREYPGAFTTEIVIKGRLLALENWGPPSSDPQQMLSAQLIPIFILQQDFPAFQHRPARDNSGKASLVTQLYPAELPPGVTQSNSCASRSPRLQSLYTPTHAHLQLHFYA